MPAVKKPTVDELFVRNKGKVSPTKCFAIRQTGGPEPHDTLVVRGHDVVDAARQWFNYYGLNEQTARYRYTAAIVPDDHPACKDAITCDHPRVQGQHEDLYTQNYRDLNEILGEAKE